MIQHRPLSLVLFSLLSELVDILVFLVDFVKLVISFAKAHDRLHALSFQWVVVDLDLDDGLVLLEGILDHLTRLGLDKVVSEAEALDCGEWALDHLNEFLCDVLALDLAF